MAIPFCEDLFELVDEALGGAVVLEVVDVEGEVEVVLGVVREGVELGHDVGVAGARGVAVGYEELDEVLVVDVVGLAEAILRTVDGAEGAAVGGGAAPRACACRAGRPQ